MSIRPPRQHRRPPHRARWMGVLIAAALSAPALADAPAGMVVAFDAASCPQGWSELATARGRAIMGAGQGAGLTARGVGETPGAETHTLSVAEMPGHQHGLYTYANSSQGDGNFFWGTASQPQTVTTSTAGGGQAHNIMQPYIVLLLCEKD